MKHRRDLPSSTSYRSLCGSSGSTIYLVSARKGQEIWEYTINNKRTTKTITVLGRYVRMVPVKGGISLNIDYVGKKNILPVSSCLIWDGKVIPIWSEMKKLLNFIKREELVAYKKLCPGTIGHCDTRAAPSISVECFWVIPCQCYNTVTKQLTPFV